MRNVARHSNDEMHKRVCIDADVLSQSHFVLSANLCSPLCGNTLLGAPSISSLLVFLTQDTSSCTPEDTPVYCTSLSHRHTSRGVLISHSDLQLDIPGVTCNYTVLGCLSVAGLHCTWDSGT